jgi:hypothetical protein
MVTGCGCMVTGCGFMVTGCGFMVTGCGFMVTGCGFMVTGCGFRKKDTTPSARGAVPIERRRCTSLLNISLRAKEENDS